MSPLPQGPGDDLRRRVAALRRAGASEAEIEAALDELQGGMASPPAPAPATAHERPDFSDVTGGSSGPTRDERTGRTVALVRGGLRGALLGGADEAAGLLHRLLPQRFPLDTDQYRQLEQQTEQDRPGAFLTGEVAGSLVIPAGGAKALATAPTLAARVVQGAKAGAAFGAASGALSGDDPSDRLGRATLGAAGGGIVGGALPIAGAAIRGVANTVGLPQAARVARTGLAERVGGAETRLGRAIAPREEAPRDFASRYVASQLARDEVTPAQLAARASAPVAGGGRDVFPGRAVKPRMLAELAGENTRDALGAVATLPGPGKETVGRLLTQRGEATGERLAGDVFDALRMRPKDVFRKAEELAAERSEAAKELYGAAFQRGTVDDPTINRLLQKPSFQRAWGEARRLAAERGIKLPKLWREVKRNGKVVKERVEVPTVQALHYLKLGLDDMVKAGHRAPLERGGIGPTRAAAILDNQSRFLKALDDAVPEYAMARAQYAGDTQVMEALENGRAFYRQRPEILRRMISGKASDPMRLSEAEIEQFRLGALDAIRTRLDESTDGANLVKRIYGSATKKKQLRALFGDDATYRNFLERMQQEAAMIETQGRTLRNSITMRRGAAMADLEGAVDRPALPPTTLRGAAGAALDRFYRAAQQRAAGLSSDRSAAAANLLTASPQQGQRFLDVLEELERARQRAALQGGQQALTRGRLIGGSTTAVQNP